MAADPIDLNFCPDLLKDPVQSKWITSLPHKERRPVCELYNKLAEFKKDESLRPHLMVDTLIRFLHCKDMKVAPAEKDMRAYFEWRKSFRVDEKVAAYESSHVRKVFEKYTSYSTFGFDRNGMPVKYNPMGLSDPDGITKLIGMENWVLAHIWDNERSLEQARKIGIEKGILIYNWLLVIDVGGFELGRAMRAIEAYSDVAKILDRYYPHRNSKVLLINMPWIFATCFKTAKGILSEGTQDFVDAYGEKPKEWISDLLVHIDSNQIPCKLGGSAPGIGKDWYLPSPPQKMDKLDKNDSLVELKKII